MTPIEILLLVRGLKVGTRFMAAMQGGEHFQDWDLLAYQMANVIDAINNNTYVLTSANSKRKPKAPKPSYRPSKAKSKPQNAFRTQLELAKQRKRGG